MAGATERATSVPRDPNWAPDDESEDEDDEEMVVEQEEEPMAPRAIRLRFQRLEVAMGEAYVRIAKLEEEVEELNAQLNVQSAVAECEYPLPPAIFCHKSAFRHTGALLEMREHLKCSKNIPEL